MIIDLYVNSSKDPNKVWLNKIKDLANEYGVDFKLITESDFANKTNSSALFVIGGDGTILNLIQYASNNNIPIVGLNAGKLGFLTEFELDELDEAFSLFINGKLKKDIRSILNVSVNDFNYLALNDAVVQRIFIEDRGNNVVDLEVSIDDISVDKIIGDGVVVSTPTGTTAYSLSAGGAIFAPGINAFSITPIAAHSFNQRPIVYSSNSLCSVKVVGDCATGLFIDGIFAQKVDKLSKVNISSSDKHVIFLRKEGFNFYKRLSRKLKDRNGI